MEIKENKFKRGDKVIDEYGNIYIVLEISSYSFIHNDYWYGVENDIEKRVMLESKLELYQEPPKTVWELQKGDECYFIASDGQVLPETWCNYTSHLPVQLENRKLGNCFLTKGEALADLERRNIEAEMLRLGGRRKSEQGKANWFLEYRPSSSGIEALWSSYEMDQGVIYFESEEKAKKAVETIGEDRIKKYIFGVES